MARSCRAVLGACLATLAVAAPAAAAPAPTSVAPRQHAKVAVGTQPTFSVRDHSSVAKRYGIFVTIASVYKVRHGELQKDDTHGTFSSMKRGANDLYRYKPMLYTFPDYFLQRPGTYWWQAYHIDCGSHPANSCHVLGSIRSFTVG